MKTIKKLLLSAFVIVLGITALSVFAFVPINIVNNNDNAWMNEIADTTETRKMSIPGTHDSGATHSIVDVAGKCQDTSISEKLKMGVRFFDLRLQNVSGEFKIVHSFVDQRLTFASVLKTYKKYIKSNPSEFLILSIKEEEAAKNSTLGFEELLLKYLHIYEDVISYDRELPLTLGEARGKIYLLSRYANSTIGIEAYCGWKDDTSFTTSTLRVQDNYNVKLVRDKMSDIEATLSYSSLNSDRLVLNFTSCYLSDGFPPSYAGTPAKYINPWLINFLSENDVRTGILIVDFATTKLISTIYGRNF